MTMRPVTTGTWKVVLLGAATSLVLAGCAGDPTPAAGGPGATSTSTAGQEAGQPSASDGTTSQGAGTGKDSGTGSSGSGSDGSTGSSDAPDSGDDGTGDGNGGALEMPKEPAPTVSSLQELLEDVGSAPLVTAPLPRAASARGRLVTRFPAFLRPTRATTVETSGISPSGSRLQVTLTATTSLTPEQVLVAYRTRLGGRGLTEMSAPATVAGSEAAAFQRGRSVVTVTATPDGTRTSYAVHATLHTGGE
jgi:hypothetical protein